MKIKKIVFFATICCSLTNNFALKKILAITDMNGTRSTRPVEYDENKKVSDLKEAIKQKWELDRNSYITFTNIDIKDNADVADLTNLLDKKDQKAVIFRIETTSSKKRARSESDDEAQLPSKQPKNTPSLFQSLTGWWNKDK